MLRPSVCVLLVLMLGCDAQQKLGVAGATCRASADCAGELQCIDATCVDAAQRAARDAEQRAVMAELTAELDRLKQEEAQLKRDRDALDEQLRVTSEAVRKLPATPVAAPAVPVAGPVVVAPSGEAGERDTLHVEDIKAGAGPAKERALEVCRQFAGNGEKVKLKLAISGPTGTVSAVSVEDDAGNPRLGSCCARELRTATFPKARNERIGAMLSLSF